jgi:archaellum component FlaC
MLNEDDPLHSVDKTLKEMRKRLKGIKELYKRLNNGVEWKSANENRSAITTQEMLQNSRNNIEKLKELSRRLDSI